MAPTTARSGGAASRPLHPSNVLPPEEEARRMALRPESWSTRRTGDARLYLSAGYALILQVAHPTVGAGVRDHSTFAEDPWGRLLRTMDYLYLFSHGGPEGGATIGRRLREAHKPIKGSNPDGSRYHALEPEAWAWVHATLIESVIRSYRRFVGRLDHSDAERFYAEWEQAGRILGIRPGDLPADWAGFRDYFDTMVNDRLERNETVDKVLRTINSPAAPPMPFLKPLWPLLRVPPRRALNVVTSGLMPPVLRERLGMDWNRRMALELATISAASRALTPVIPAEWLDIGPRHLAWRAAEIEAGPLGSAADRPTVAA